MKWYLKVWKNWSNFNDRSQRKEFWMFALFNSLIYFIFWLLEFLFDLTMIFGILTLLYWLVVLVPTIAVTVRRLHDTGKTGWLILLWFIPIVGSLILLVFMVLDSSPEENQYGKSPKYSET